MPEYEFYKVTVDQEVYDRLVDSELMLVALESAGVDNWQGYEYAMEEYQEMKEE